MFAESQRTHLGNNVHPNLEVNIFTFFKYSHHTFMYINFKAA
jgi:hypothetical protein